MSSRDCIICGEQETAENRHYELPCCNHWVCKDNLTDYYIKATENESLYPPQCCGTAFYLDFLKKFPGAVSDDVQRAFLDKASGEYTVQPKFRVYCANKSCSAWLDPRCHVNDTDSSIVYAFCEAYDCGKITCVGCKSLIGHGINDHVCQLQEDDRKFREIVDEKGYMECPTCGLTIELMEACNHITCECGNSFCYVCGQDYIGSHGCPRYGPAIYDEDGYNQDGFHRSTGLNRAGRTRRQQRASDRHAHGDNSEDDEDDDDDDDYEEDEGDENEDGNEVDDEERREGADEDVLQHIGDEQRGIIDALPHELREETLTMLRIELFQSQGITFNQSQIGNVNQDHDGVGDENNDERDRDNEDQDIEDRDAAEHNHGLEEQVFISREAEE